MWFRLELISQWIKIVPSVPEAPPMFRLELISQWIKISTQPRSTAWARWFPCPSPGAPWSGWASMAP